LDFIANSQKTCSRIALGGCSKLVLLLRVLKRLEPMCVGDIGKVAVHQRH